MNAIVSMEEDPMPSSTSALASFVKAAKGRVQGDTFCSSLDSSLPGISGYRKRSTSLPRRGA